MFTNSPSNTITNPHEQKAAKGLLNVSPHGIPLRGRSTESEPEPEPEGARNLYGYFSDEAALNLDNRSEALLDAQDLTAEVLRQELAELQRLRQSQATRDSEKLILAAFTADHQVKRSSGKESEVIPFSAENTSRWRRQLHEALGRNSRESCLPLDVKREDYLLSETLVRDTLAAGGKKEDDLYLQEVAAQEQKWQELRQAELAAGRPEPPKPAPIPVRYAVPFEEAILRFASDNSKITISEYRRRKNDYDDANYRLYFWVVQACAGITEIENFITEHEAGMSPAERSRLDGAKLLDEVCLRFSRKTDFETNRRRANLSRMFANGQLISKYMARLEKEQQELKALGCEVDLDKDLAVKVRSEMSKDTRYKELQAFLYFSGKQTNWEELKKLVRGVDNDIIRTPHNSKMSNLNAAYSDVGDASKRQRDENDFDHVSRGHTHSTRNHTLKPNKARFTHNTSYKKVKFDKVNNYKSHSDTFQRSRPPTPHNSTQNKKKFTKFNKVHTKGSEARAKHTDKEQACFLCKKPGHTLKSCPLQANSNRSTLSTAIPAEYQEANRVEFSDDESFIPLLASFYTSTINNSATEEASIEFLPSNSISETLLFIGDLPVIYSVGTAQPGLPIKTVSAERRGLIADFLCTTIDQYSQALVNKMFSNIAFAKTKSEVLQFVEENLNCESLSDIRNNSMLINGSVLNEQSDTLTAYNSSLYDISIVCFPSRLPIVIDAHVTLDHAHNPHWWGKRHSVALAYLQYPLFIPHMPIMDNLLLSDPQWCETCATEERNRIAACVRGPLCRWCNDPWEDGHREQTCVFAYSNFHAHPLTLMPHCSLCIETVEAGMEIGAENCRIATTWERNKKELLHLCDYIIEEKQTGIVMDILAGKFQHDIPDVYGVLPHNFKPCYYIVRGRALIIVCVPNWKPFLAYSDEATHCLCEFYEGVGACGATFEALKTALPLAASFEINYQCWEQFSEPLMRTEPAAGTAKAWRCRSADFLPLYDEWVKEISENGTQLDFYEYKLTQLSLFARAPPVELIHTKIFDDILTGESKTINAYHISINDSSDDTDTSDSSDDESSGSFYLQTNVYMERIQPDSSDSSEIEIISIEEDGSNDFYNKF